MITDIEGILVGHSTDEAGITGCTVVLCPGGAVGGVEVRGGAPGTHETDLLHPLNLVQEVQAIMLGGGSAFGLGAVSGVTRYLEEENLGFATPFARVPIVPAAIIYDLDVGDPAARPTPDMAYQACREASARCAEGSVGAGTGATVGDILGADSRMKGGIGTAGEYFQQGARVAALAVVNSFGDVLDEDGGILAGARGPDGVFLDTASFVKTTSFGKPLAQNTTLVVLATNVSLTKGEANRIAQMAHDGLARSLSPVHTMFDGDTVFTLSTGQVEGRADVVGVVGADVTAEAVRRAVRLAKSLGAVPALED